MSSIRRYEIAIQVKTVNHRGKKRCKDQTRVRLLIAQDSARKVRLVVRDGRRLVGLGLALAVGSLAMPALGGDAQVRAQMSSPAAVTRVIDGDTLAARLTDGREITVRLIGIDTPETVKPGTPVECGGPEARDAMRQLAEGQEVSLVSDPTQDSVDQFGRSLFYVGRSDGVDVGEALVRAGWAEVFVFDQDFQRLTRYRAAQRDARDAKSGVWGRCDGDFHRTRAEELRERRLSAVAFMRRYYRRISNRQFVTAWRMLARALRRKLGPFSTWKAGYRRSLGVSVRSARTRLSGSRAVVTVRLRALDRDACSGRVVRQYFRGSWVLAPRGWTRYNSTRPRDAWLAVRVRMRKTSGGPVRLSKSECPAPEPAPPPSPPSPVDCQGYSPCLPPGSDVDCDGGSGDGPRYVSGPVYVNGSDPYDLDRDGDGVACES
jgi:micrococcal nuclease